MQNKVDVIIPNYNQTNLLARAIESALIQGDTINQIIIVDDGSSEETLEYLIDKFSCVQKIKIIRSARYSHPGIMRDIGLINSNSEWIAFLDADDFWEPGKIDRQLKFALENNFKVICSNGYVCKNSVRIKRFYEFDTFSKISTRILIKDNLVVNSSTLINRECFQKIGGYPRDYHLRGVEDFATWLRLSVYFQIGFLDEDLVNYEDLEDSFSKQQNSELRNIALLDFAFWSKGQVSPFSRVFLKFYLIKVLIRS
jgi:glycosyltransferase involved in cell wall biosynthesis